MRDDRIEVCGPYEDPPEWIEDYTDEDGQFVPAHYLDTRLTRRFAMEIRSCDCGHVHGVNVIVDWRHVTAYPEIIEHTLEAAMRQLVRVVDACGVTP